MPDLVLLNGPPASGKSTLAAACAQRRSLALALDIDVVRGLLGDWAARPADAGIAARRLATAMARVHLADGHDVIVPQFLATTAFIDELADIAAAAGARFVEIALMLGRADAVAAFQQRSARPETSQHRDAAAAVAEAGGTSALEAMYDTYVEMLAHRPDARIVEVIVDDIAGTIARVESAVDEIA